MRELWQYSLWEMKDKERKPFLFLENRKGFLSYYNTIIPKAFKIELTKMAIRHTGAIHLIITENNFSPLNFTFLRLPTSSAIVCGLITKPTKNTGGKCEYRHQYAVADKIKSI